MSDDIYAAWENLGKEKIFSLLRRLPEEVGDEADDLTVRLWLAQQSGLSIEHIPSGDIR